MDHILSILIFLPIFGAILGFIINHKIIKIYGIFVALIEFVLSILMYSFYNPTIKPIAFVEKFSILSSLEINYFVGIDGISLFLVVLSTFITLLALISLNAKDDTKNIIVSVLILETSMVGFFSSLDVMLFYIFWELALVPMFVIIGVYGGQNRIYACLKFFIYTFAGSIIMLVGIIAMSYIYYKSFGKISFSLLDWYNISLPFKTSVWLFLSFAIAFAIKTAIFPFHTWLPYAYTQAPVIGSVLISSLLAKMGIYGFIRILLPVFPDASVYFSDMFCVLAIIMIVYAGMIAFAKDDIKEVIAYSSISHMGIIMLGIFAINLEGMSGAVFFMISHGVLSAGLFMMAGVLQYKFGTCDISKFGSIAKIMPNFAIIFGIIMFGTIGLPLTIGFIGEFLSLLGMFKTNILLGSLGGLGAILSAICMLNLYRNVFFKKSKNDLIFASKNISIKEYISLISICLVVIIMGVYPKPVLNVIDGSVQNVLRVVYDKSLYKDTKDYINKSNLLKGDKVENY